MPPVIDIWMEFEFNFANDLRPHMDGDVRVLPDVNRRESWPTVANLCHVLFHKVDDIHRSIPMAPGRVPILTSARGILSAAQIDATIFRETLTVASERLLP